MVNNIAANVLGGVSELEGELETGGTIRCTPRFLLPLPQNKAHLLNAASGHFTWRSFLFYCSNAIKPTWSLDIAKKKRRNSDNLVSATRAFFSGVGMMYIWYPPLFDILARQFQCTQITLNIYLELVKTPPSCWSCQSNSFLWRRKRCEDARLWNRSNFIA